MSRLFRLPFVKVVLAMCLAVLSVGGMLFAIEGTSGAAPSSAVVDHQLCYTATATGFKIPTAGVRLRISSQPRGSSPTSVRW